MENVALFVQFQQHNFPIKLKSRAPKVPGENPAYLVLLEEMDHLVPPASQEFLVNLAPLESAKIAQVSMEIPFLLSMTMMSRLDQAQATLLQLLDLEVPELLAHLGFLVLLVSQVHLGPMDTKVHLANLDKLEPLALLAPLE